jgi:hypothetical protein
MEYWGVELSRRSMAMSKEMDITEIVFSGGTVDPGEAPPISYKHCGPLLSYMDWLQTQSLRIQQLRPATDALKEQHRQLAERIKLETLLLKNRINGAWQVHLQGKMKTSEEETIIYDSCKDLLMGVGSNEN